MVTQCTEGVNVMTKKTGILSTQEKYDIQQMLQQEKSQSEIASELNRSENMVEKYIDGELEAIYDTLAKIKTKDVVDEIKAPDPKISNKAKIINRTGIAKRKGISVMTAAGSACGDALRQRMKKRLPKRGITWNIEKQEIEDDRE